MLIETKDIDFGEKFKSKISTNNTNLFFISYNVKKNFRLPFEIHFSVIGNGKKRFYEKLGLKPINYTFDISITKKSTEKSYLNLIKEISLKGKYMEELIPILQIYRTPNLKNIKFENLESISSSLIDLEIQLNSLEHFFSQLEYGIYVQNIIKTHGKWLGCGCETCEDEFIPIGYKDLEKIAKRIKGLKRIELYTGLSENTLDKQRATNIIETSYIKPIKEEIEIHLLASKYIKQNLEKKLQ